MPLLCGCGLEKVQEETRLCKTAKEDGKQFFEYLKEEDIQSLSDLFSADPSILCPVCLYSYFTPFV